MNHTERTEDEIAAMFELHNAAYAALRADPEAWAAELAERRLWDVTLADGLDDDDGDADTAPDVQPDDAELATRAARGEWAH